jgi:hypothetical protein
MFELTLFILVSICLFGAIDTQITSRNTIFDDEKLEGGAFQNIDYFNDVSRNDASAYRLPRTTKPIHYDAFWAISMTDLTFAGNVDIYLHATQANVNEIVLHAHDLEITSLNLYKDDEEVYQTFNQEPAYHFLRVQLINGVLDYNETNAIQYKLTISFEAPLRNDMNGLYRSWFRNNFTEEERLVMYG